MTASAWRARSLPRLLSTNSATARSTSSGATGNERGMRSDNLLAAPGAPGRRGRGGGMGRDGLLGARGGGGGRGRVVGGWGVRGRERKRPPFHRLSRRSSSASGSHGWGIGVGRLVGGGGGGRIGVRGPNSSSWTG